MFNWICPECGRDVSPSATECPYCAERKKTGEVVAPVVDPAAAYTTPPSQGPYAAPPPAYQPPAPSYQTHSDTQYRPEPRSYAPPQPVQAPPQPHYAHPQQHYGAAPPSQHYPPQPPSQQQPYYGYPPPRKPGLPTWAVGILSALAFLGLIAGIYWAYQYFGKGPRAERAGTTEPAAAARSKPANPLQKYIEVVGIRLVNDARKRPEARFLVVNHANTEFNDITANVTLYASTSRSEEDAIGTFTFKLGSIEGNSSKEMTQPLNTKLKTYELPDWQNVTADVQITTP